MLDSEFKKKVPMVVALNESVDFFNKGKFLKAIETLEEVLKQDPSKDFTGNIRKDVWYNLSINYILTNQFNKAFYAITNFITFGHTRGFYRVYFKEELTQSQKNMLKSSHMLQSYKFYLNSSKHKKSFQLFVKDLANKLDQIEHNEINVNGEGYKSLITILTIIKEIITYFAEFDRKNNTYIFADKEFVNIFNKTQNLLKYYIVKENESIINSLKEKISESEELIEREQFSKSFEKLAKILNDYYNYQIGGTGSLVTDAVKRYKTSQAYNTDENFKKIIDLLELSKEKKIEQIKISYDKKLEEIEKFINTNNLSTKIEEVEDFLKEVKQYRFKVIESHASELLKKFKMMQKENEESQKVAEQFKEFQEKFGELEKKIEEFDLSKCSQISNLTEASSFLSERNNIGPELLQIYARFKKNSNTKKKVTDLALKFYEQHLKFNPFKINIQYLSSTYNSFKKSDFSLLESHWKDNDELMSLYKELIKIDNEELISEELKRIAEEVKELSYNVPIENMYNFLLDFSQIIPDPKLTKTEDSSESKYSLATQMGKLDFEIVEKKPPEKIVYHYDFLNSTWGEKGKVTMNFVEPASGSVSIKLKNEIQEISKTNKDNLTILNILGTYLKTYLDLNIGKIVAKQVQTILYEKSFDDLTMGNYRILQAKLNTIGKDIDKLKAKYFEVRAPLNLTSFDCSECGATLNITSKEEKFIICEHCDTPFLMEWQKD
ncbi:MAG: hypothetical protein JSV62_06855 [Promethearchaeota archaeon]|nr:MAG: hypothetical protein JSV62_06855 [Candidatus Lokiarchaeota archaeon]